MEYDKELYKEEVIQWEKGEIRCIGYDFGSHYARLEMRFEGCIDSGETLEFRVGDLGLLSRVVAKISGKKAGSARLLKMGEFYPIGFKYKGNRIEAGFTPLELIARGEEKDYVVKVKFVIPEKPKEKSEE